MTTIFDVYNFINFICDKNRRGYLSPEEVSSALDAGQNDLFHYYWGLPATAQALKGGAPTPDYGSSQLTLDALRPFRKKQDILPSSLTSTSYLDLNTVVPDYAYYLGLYGIGGTSGPGGFGVVEIEQYLNTELVDALNSSLYPVTDYTPMFVFENSGIQLYPITYKDTANAKGLFLRFQYISKPTTPVIGYNIVGNSIVYDPSTSTQLEFQKEYWMEVISRALSYIGVNLSAAEVNNLAVQEYTAS